MKILLITLLIVNLLTVLAWVTLHRSNYSGRHHLDATNKMLLYPLPHKSI